jgi:uncharacterized protein YraI
VLPALAEAAPAFSTANVNMRSGPSTRYPAVVVIPVGTRVEILGCLSSANWCDVSFAGYRGWVSGSYLQTTYSQRRVYVEPEYYRPLGIPTVTFSIGRYWDDNYRNRDFYRDRDRWRDGDYRPRPEPQRPESWRPGPDFGDDRPQFDRNHQRNEERAREIRRESEQRAQELQRDRDRREDQRRASQPRDPNAFSIFCQQDPKCRARLGN